MSNYIQKEKEQAIADLDKTIARLTATRQALFSDLNKDVPLLEQLFKLKEKAKGTWVILQNGSDRGVYYQFEGTGVGKPIVGLMRNGTYSNVTGHSFNLNFRLASASEVKQHLEYLATKEIRMPLISIKGETPSVKFDPMKCEFYMVTCSGFRGAKVRHTNYAEAEQVAKDLAKQRRTQDLDCWCSCQC